MSQINVNIRMDEKLKKDFETILEQMGLTMTGAFNIFAKTVVRQKRIPFELNLASKDERTLEVLEEVLKLNRSKKLDVDLDESLED